jgi:ketosteroid isomerase-like protein
MSRENVELVRRGYEYFSRTGETDESIYSPDLEWHGAADDPGLETFHGVEGLKQLIQQVRESLDDFRTEPFEFLDAGDRVVAGLLHTGRGRESGAEVEMREWNVFVVKEGKIVAVHEYRDREEALRVAGLTGQGQPKD